VRVEGVGCGMYICNTMIIYRVGKRRSVLIYTKDIRHMICSVKVEGMGLCSYIYNTMSIHGMGKRRSV